MNDEIRRGLESLVAAFLREHVAPAVFEREEVRRGLGPEHLDRVRREVLARLEAAERDGANDRERVREIVGGLLGAAVSGPTSAALLALLGSWLDQRTRSREEPG